MVAAKLLRLLSASLHTIRHQRSAERGQRNDGRREAITASDTPLAERGARALLAWGRATGRWWQRSYICCVQHHCTRSAASAVQSAARHMTAGARLSLQVTCRWPSAGRMPCSNGAGRQADGGSKATMAALHTIHRQRSAELASHVTGGARQSLHVTRRWRSAGRLPCSHGAGFQAGGGSEATMASLHTVCRKRSAAERCPPHDCRREAVTACDKPLAKRGAHALLAWGRV
jgi:hypothetical protein